MIKLAGWFVIPREGISKLQKPISQLKRANFLAEEMHQEIQKGTGSGGGPDFKIKQTIT